MYLNYCDDILFFFNLFEFGNLEYDIIILC